jgi:hypothetical protein
MKTFSQYKVAGLSMIAALAVEVPSAAAYPAGQAHNPNAEGLIQHTPYHASHAAIATTGSGSGFNWLGFAVMVLLLAAVAGVALALKRIADHQLVRS